MYVRHFASSRALTLRWLAWLVPLRLRGGRILLCEPCSIYQLSHIFGLRNFDMVCKSTSLEGSQWVLLVSKPPLHATSMPYVTHSCFNAFARVDVRVDVRIPGGVNAYIIDLRGER
jgi:hypothetical protein